MPKGIPPGVKKNQRQCAVPIRGSTESSGESVAEVPSAAPLNKAITERLRACRWLLMRRMLVSGGPGDKPLVPDDDPRLAVANSNYIGREVHRDRLFEAHRSGETGASLPTQRSIDTPAASLSIIRPPHRSDALLDLGRTEL
jgi:hypothetical protein